MQADPAEISVTDNPADQRFKIHAGTELAGFLEYRSRANRIALVHTEIDSAFEGRGLANHLISHVFDQARTRSLEVLPREIAARLRSMLEP